MHQFKAFFLSLAISLITFSSPANSAEMSVETVAGAVTIDSATAKQLFDQGALFVDTRSNSDWDAGRIPDAVHLELKSAFTQDAMAAYGKGDPLVCYCNGPTCPRASVCAAKAVEWGFTKVNYYRDGFPAWKAAGYPVE